MSLRIKFIFLLSTIFLVVVANTFIIYVLDKQGQAKLEAVIHTHDVLDESEKLYNQITNAETGQRGYLLTQDLNYLEPYYAALEQVKQHFLAINRLTLSNPEQQNTLAVIDELVDKKLAELALTVTLVMQNTPYAIEEAKAIVLTNEGKQYMDQIRKHILLFQNIERAKLEQQNADYQRNRLFITRFVTLQIPLIVTLLVFCAFYINSRLFKPLKLLIQNTEQLEKGERPKMLTINYNDEIGFVLKRFARMSDIVYKRTSKLNFQASHDHLTGVLNRTELKPALKQAISTCSKDSKLAVIFIDINKFKKLNDEYGHLIGDQILIETAKRITSSVRADDDVYRYGGDEFVIITHNIAKYRYVNAMITHLLARFDNPFVLEQLTLNISLSIGVALAPDHSLNHQHLLKLADQAMYHAKHESKNSYHIHNNRG
ncbi:MULTISPECIES: diguanylate cyclase [unclassified Pseudoalteromonas]|uniref:diguanylate cyclase domain-containing protein n=1 Tax=unclassified Pseudoalteromonas TaxID=194690 RepID=UPI00110AFE68|nr:MULTISPECIES: diguanylate cyclase [unclassified Pseudoalteromonas]MED5513720.1 diguanylate cyclase [Pseudomonadota bacterium]MBC7006969.1 diguanylate cyclase [Pseudoalteromonas sp. BZK2]NHH89653.1 putative signaling protein [Pseudoalteromonas sp. MB47]TMP48099.1 diguanylate cyclase [Pseudoalteromonas sp. S1650]TMP66311.1 diguanylate cyclase [Pseudoalteromonas sp. S1649]